MLETTLPDLVADLVALRHAGGYRFKIQERVLRQFADHCRREGYPDASITKEAVDEFLYGRHLRSSTVRRNELALRQLAKHAQAVGWDAYIPATTTRVRVRHQPPYVLTDDEVRRLFAAIDSQAMSCYSNKAMVDPVLFSGVPPAFRTADQIGSDPERTRGIDREIHEIQARVS